MKGRIKPKDNRSRGGNKGYQPLQQPTKQTENKPKDYSTVILYRKKALHRLIAEDGQGPSEDASVNRNRFIKRKKKKRNNLYMFSR